MEEGKNWSTLRNVERGWGRLDFPGVRDSGGGNLSVSDEIWTLCSCRALGEVERHLMELLVWSWRGQKVPVVERSCMDAVNSQGIELKWTTWI